jgi:ribosomal protein L11 methylase PrmA
MRNNKARFTVKKQDIIRQPVARQYDLVIANMNSAILEAAWSNIMATVTPQGILILSGIGVQWSKDIKALLVKSKYHLQQEKTVSGWWSAVCIPTLKGVK